MARVRLQDMVADIPFGDLPANWNSFDLATFSPTKELWDYQEDAVKSALKVLWKYYEDFGDHDASESPDTNQKRKQRLYQWYLDNGLDVDIGIPVEGSRKIAKLLSEYYLASGGKVPYEHFINRACFWMATGSGKTLVIVKLIEILWQLAKREEIPAHDILVLTHRDDLIDQLKSHVHEFNSGQGNLFIRLAELRDYATVKRETPSLFKERELTVFYYRSDNLSDEQKEKIIDFHNYDDSGRWFVFLDEAHKGDKEDSKRQQIYSILSRNGFLFNFSATFTDVRDLVTTAFNFNLSEFIRAGYGKHIAILKQELRAFKQEDDYSPREKQKIVLKSLLMLAYARTFSDAIRKLDGRLYHKPLLLVLVNSVNVKDADLKLFFREVERFATTRALADVWRKAKNELWSELKGEPSFMFEKGLGVRIDKTIFQRLTQKDILRLVFNSESRGEIEILVRPSNKQELALKLKSSERPFALIKIGNISGWLKDLAGYEVSQKLEEETYFEQLNREESDINVLMGSRGFYEGWDSNRPNVINFVNIGVGTDAKKFILQSIGRGVRIEPLKDKRKRLLSLHNAKEVDEELFDKINDKVVPPETLFIFGTNRAALQTVVEQLDQEIQKEEWLEFCLYPNEAATRNRQLLVPTYKEADQPLFEQRSPAKFEATAADVDLLKRYVEYVCDDRVLLALHDAEPEKLRFLRQSLETADDFFNKDGRSFKSIAVLVQRILDYFGVFPEKLDGLKELRDEIQHFKKIKVNLKDISELLEKVENVRNYRDPSHLEAELKAKLAKRKINLDLYTEQIKQVAKLKKEERFERKDKELRIRHVANHYYVPVLLSGEMERVDYIKHIIQTRSEVDFVNHLEKYLEQAGNRLKDFDWWLFSKLDEALDEVYIPYYSPKSNSISRFKPDFIFWLRKGDAYFIVFIDPKGTEHTDYQHKIDGYRTIFEVKAKEPKVIKHNGVRAKVFAYLYTADVNKVSERYRPYWFDNIAKTLETILRSV